MTNTAQPADAGLDFFVPVLTYPDPAPASGFTRLFDFAATLGGTIHAELLEIDIPPIVDPLPVFGLDVAAMVEESEARSRASGVALSSVLRQQAERSGLPLTIDKSQSRGEFAAGLLAASARTHDMTLMCMIDTYDYRDLAEAILFQSGAPIVLFPDTGASTALDTIAIAWDGSRAAARALHDALPVLKHAQRVIVMTAERDKVIDTRSVDRAIALLDHHDVSATHQEVLMLERHSVADALQEAAVLANAGLLVMGGYGHSRLREFVRGGATDSIIKGRRLPVLMSH